MNFLYDIEEGSENKVREKLKKYIGGFLFMLVGVFVNLNPASAFTVGAEEMPESMKNLR